MKLFGIFLLTLVLPSNARVISTAKQQNPAHCGSWQARKTVVVNDKQGNERVLVCLKHNGQYIWRQLDSSSSLGEIFNPAKDCADIAKMNQNAKDGFYWVQTPGIKKVTKVWCDVTTDGGGFMLVGYKNSPVSWILPSNDNLVYPNKNPHWSSAFGNVLISEFRIQISTTNSSQDTKADWLYSFSSPRRLTDLFINDQGCTSHYPGVGNIKYVKDVLTGNIVSQNFQCSQFGPTYPSNLGSKMMNKCLREPCKDGFAVLPGMNATRYDNYGAFSYSTSSPRSGVDYHSTAFIGCEHGKCCACFGPKGARGDFCSPGCRSINNGTVTNTSHAWFWIRSFSPETPIWKKCMEFKVEKKGKLETYFIEDSTGVAKKGSCEQQGIPNIIDGVVKVRNEAALKSLPLVEGLLSYRKDNAQLYLSNGTSWNALGKGQNKVVQNELVREEKQIANVTQRLRDVAAKLELKVKELQNKLNKSKEASPAKSCRDILLRNPNATSGVHWIKPMPGSAHPAFGVYCDMKTHQGGWTLVYSYTFTDYNNFYSKTNAVTPRPNWPVREANVPVSTIPPLDEWSTGAVDFNLWKEIGEEILVKSNINDWLVCQPHGGSLVARKNGAIKCQNIKNVAKRCHSVTPIKLAWHRYGPFLSANSVFYDFVQSTQDDWPAHDPCGKRKPNHKKGVTNPGGAIFIR